MFGALKHYDLPVLARALAPRPVWVVNAVDPVGARLASGDVAKVYTGEVRVRDRRPDDGVAAAYREMLGK